MKTKKQNVTLTRSMALLLSTFMLTCTQIYAANGFVKVEPSESGVNLSSRYTVTVNGIPIPVIKVKGSIAPSYVQFSFAGAVDVVIHVNEAVSSYTLTPKSYNITSAKSGSDISFTLDKPRHLILHHVNSSTESLGIFAESIEENVPIPGGSVLNVMNYGVDNTGATDNSTQIQNALNAVASGGTLYFPAGKYTANLLKPKANTTVYLAAGAVLQAISASSSVSSMFYISNSGVSIRGRGVIEGRGDIHRAAGKMYNLIEEHGGNFSMEGVILRTAPAWNIMTHGNNLSFKNVKWINNCDYPNGDGVGTTGTNITVDNCIMMITDDPLALHSIGVAGNMNTIVKNTVLFNQVAGGRFFLLGYYTGSGTTTHWDAENLDMANGYRIISNTTGNAFEFWQAKGVISDCSFQNIRLENPCNSLVAGVTYWDFTQWIPGDVGSGSINNISFKDVQQEYFGTIGSVNPSLCPWTNGRNSFNAGWYSTVTSANTISNIAFDNYYVNGNRITNTTEGQFAIGNHVTNITFPSSASTKVNIVATDLLADDKGGNDGQFAVSRTGSKTSDLEVFYTIHGTAINGTNYNTINNSLVIPAGSETATITITPVSGSAESACQTVFLSLNKNSNYMVDANYHAVVTISDGNSDNEAPSKPENVDSSSVLQSGFLLKWNACSDNVGVANYEIRNNGIFMASTTDTSYRLSGLLPATEYKITVKAWDGSGNASESEVFILSTRSPDSIAPSVPSDLHSSSIFQTSFKLSWTASTDNIGVKSYEIFSNNVLIGTTTTNSYTDTGLKCASLYALAVRAGDDAGNWSAKSEVVNITTSVCGGSNIALNKAVRTSSNENTTNVGTKAVDGKTSTRWASSGGINPQWIWVDLGATFSITQVKLIWEVASAKEYKIQVSNDTVSWADVYSTSTGDGDIDDVDGLSVSGRYVRIFGTVRNTIYGYSLWEFEVYGSYLSGDILPPSVPSGLASSALTDSSFTVSWKASTDNICLATYEIFKDDVFLASTSKTTYSLSDLISSTEYKITVRALDCTGNASPLSSVLRVSTLLTDISESSLNKLSIYPNPVVEHKLTIDFKNTIHTKEASIQITNMNGRIEFQTTVSVVEKATIHLPDSLDKGIYIICIKGGKISTSNKIVIE